MADFEVHRHIEGGNADFQAGCVLSGFDLNPSIRITSKLCVKSDANTILISRRPGTDLGPSIMRGILQSVGGPLRFCHRPPPSVRGRWHLNTIAGFYQPENAHAALKHFNGSPDVEARLVYTVYFTAPKEISDAVLVEVEEIASQAEEVQIAWEEPRNGMVTLRLSGTERDKIVDTKSCLEVIFAGRIAQKVIRGRGYEIWHPFFATPAGKIWLQHLARDNGVIIVSDKLQQRVNFHELDIDDYDCRFRVERKLAEKVIELDGRQETHSIKLNTVEFRKLIASDAVAKVQKKLGNANVSLDILKKTLVLHCAHQMACLVTQELNLPLPPPALVKTYLECPQCGDATKDVEYSDCGHVSCMDCFDHQLSVASSDLTSNHFPLLCWEENCGQPIAIKDLRKYAASHLIDDLMRASLTYHIRSFPDVYRNCRTPDCKSVYLRNGSYETFTCPTCLTQTCTKCHVEPHAGWTCAEYETHLSKTQSNERLLEDYKTVAGTKECPKCATLIEKVDGCNHVECSGCHGHICWVCLKVFGKSEGAYQHMNDLHGGNGLVDAGAEEEGSDFDSDGDDDDEDEWEDDDSDLDGERFAYNFWHGHHRQFW